MTIYKQELKVKILSALDDLHPFKQIGEPENLDCPHCFEKGSYLYYSGFKYGRCTECSREDGFEYYSTVMGRREVVYKKMRSKIEATLN